MCEWMAGWRNVSIDQWMDGLILYDVLPSFSKAGPTTRRGGAAETQRQRCPVHGECPGDPG